jgi:hypothetical protein
MDNQLYNNESYRVKNLKWGGMHQCLPSLRKKVRFLEFHKC